MSELAQFVPETRHWCDMNKYKQVVVVLSSRHEVVECYTVNTSTLYYFPIICKLSDTHTSINLSVEPYFTHKLQESCTLRFPDQLLSWMENQICLEQYEYVKELWGTSFSLRIQSETALKLRIS